ncbi:MAG: hypothetical protein EAX96_05155 [Candidatus Lokiarchaeota archaeon]|nr:hypothetical protein [Candidatus Lokiarchaeota archaeon]
MQNPLEFVGYGIIILIVIFVILNIRVLLQKYKHTENKNTLVFTFAFIMFLGAIVTLLIQTLTLELDEFIGRMMAILALIFSGTAIVLINYFSFNNTFPEKKVGLTIIISLVAVIYVSILTHANINGLYGGNLSDIIAGEVAYDPTISLISFICLIPLGLISPIMFFYFSVQSASLNKANSLRSFWMGVAISAFFSGYILEVMAIASPIVDILLIFGRILMFVAALILYICFSMPDWFKNKIGWVEE